MRKKLSKKFITLHTLFIAGIGGLLPDIDIPINYIAYLLGYSSPLLEHGGIFHTPLFGLLFIIPGLILWKQKKHKAAMYIFVITFGIFFHLFLDYLLGGGNHYGIMWFWPLATTQFKIHLLLKTASNKLPMIVDAFILLAWLWHEEVKHKIKDFI